MFYDIFSIINISFMQLKFNLGRDSQKYGLQNGSFTFDFDVLLLGDKGTHL